MTRVFGEKLHLSVPTAIPFEERVVGVDVPVREMWCNIYTLFRNYHGAYEDPLKVPRGEFLALFIEELGTLSGLVQGVVDMYYFIPNLPDLRLKLPLAKHKEPKTPKQKAYATLEKQAIEAVRASPTVHAVEIRHLLPYRNVPAWILTHSAVDLLSRYQFATLELLESHTGELKPPSRWNSKLSNNPDYKHLPFNILTLQVLGDRGHLFYAHTSQYRKALLALSRERGWSPSTTRAKVLSDLKYIPDPDVQATFKAMLSVNLT